MAHAIKLVQGDTAPLLYVSLTNNTTAAPIDVSNAVVTMTFRAEGSEAVIDILTATLLPGRVRANGTVDNSTQYDTIGSGGRMSFAWTSTAVDSPAGYYTGEIVITYDDDSVQTIYDYLKFYIRASGVSEWQDIPTDNTASEAGIYAFYDTYADALAAVDDIPEGSVIEVLADENYSDVRTIYRVQNGALVFKIYVDAFIQAGTGAVTRSNRSKMRDIFDARDFGVIGAGVLGQDDAAWQLALDTIETRGGGTLVAEDLDLYFNTQSELVLSGLTKSGGIRGGGTRLRTSGDLAAIRLTGSSTMRPFLVEGFLTDHTGNATARCAYEQVRTAYVEWRDCAVLADNGVSATYAGWRLRHSDVNDINTGCYWTHIHDCVMRSTGGIVIPRGLWIEGAHNAISTDGTSFSGVIDAIYASKPVSTTLPAGSGRVGGNTTKVNGYMEGVTNVVHWDGEVGDYAPHSLHIGSRIEVATNILKVTGCTLNSIEWPNIEPASIQAVTNIATVPAGIYYNYSGITNTTYPLSWVNNKGYRLRSTDASVDVLRVTPLNYGSGISLTYQNLPDTDGWYVRPYSPGLLIRVGVNLSGYNGQVFTGVKGISSSNNVTPNFIFQVGAMTAGVVNFDFTTAGLTDETNSSYEIVVLDPLVGKTYGVTSKATTGFTLTSSDNTETTNHRVMLVRYG